MNERPSLADTALALLRSRHWAGPDANPAFERFLMQSRASSARRTLMTRGPLLALLLGGAAVTAAAGISAGYYGLLRKTDGTAYVVHAKDNGDGTLTLTYKDGRTETAHKLRNANADVPPPERELPPGVFMLAAPIGGEFLDADGNPVAVTHDLRPHEERFPESKHELQGRIADPSPAPADAPAKESPKPAGSAGGGGL